MRCARRSRRATSSRSSMRCWIRRAARCRYCNAGHLPPLLATATGGVRRLTTGGMVLGIADEAAYTEGVARLGPGDALAFYTDGLTESLSPARRGVRRGASVGRARASRIGRTGRRGDAGCPLRVCLRLQPGSRRRRPDGAGWSCESGEPGSSFLQTSATKVWLPWNFHFEFVRVRAVSQQKASVRRVSGLHYIRRALVRPAVGTVHSAPCTLHPCTLAPRSRERH